MYFCIYLYVFRCLLSSEMFNILNLHLNLNENNINLIHNKIIEKIKLKKDIPYEYIEFEDEIYITSTCFNNKNSIPNSYLGYLEFQYRRNMPPTWFVTINNLKKESNGNEFSKYMRNAGGQYLQSNSTSRIMVWTPKLHTGKMINFHESIIMNGKKYELSGDKFYEYLLDLINNIFKENNINEINKINYDNIINNLKNKGINDYKFFYFIQDLFIFLMKNNINKDIIGYRRFHEFKFEEIIFFNPKKNLNLKCVLLPRPESTIIINTIGMLEEYIKNLKFIDFDIYKNYNRLDSEYDDILKYLIKIENDKYDMYTRNNNIYDFTSINKIKKYMNQDIKS